MFMVKTEEELITEMLLIKFGNLIFPFSKTLKVYKKSACFVWLKNTATIF